VYLSILSAVKANKRVYYANEISQQLTSGRPQSGPISSQVRVNPNVILWELTKVNPCGVV